jgi:hypothetical protein
VLADSAALRQGRYEIWAKLDAGSARARALIRLLAERRTYLSPTLAVFERRAGDKDTTDVHVRGFQRMVELTGQWR